ncbi:hypothetical protein BUALT_Bualt06G0148500 [Buddleja alternifolia]|uniref:Uncharacterized protein n=1 Tax=Buddleja alternifolia TaxID=168488 RepID=A0AAV6XRG7_9LAMI|nr:hypothetical protein BUALT_Bualt06G0148500 [Buddleja alternifolia]
MRMLASKYLAVKAKMRATETHLIIHSLLLRDKKMVQHLFHRGTLPNTFEDEDYHQSHNIIAAASFIHNPNATTSIIENKMGAQTDDENPASMILEMVKNDKGQEFRLENDIDRVADLFIQRFHQQIRLQKLHPESPLS